MAGWESVVSQEFESRTCAGGGPLKLETTGERPVTTATRAPLQRVLGPRFLRPTNCDSEAERCEAGRCLREENDRIAPVARSSHYDCDQPDNRDICIALTGLVEPSRPCRTHYHHQTITRPRSGDQSRLILAPFIIPTPFFSRTGHRDGLVWHTPRVLVLVLVLILVLRLAPRHKTVSSKQQQAHLEPKQYPRPRVAPPAGELDIIVVPGSQYLLQPNLNPHACIPPPRIIWCFLDSVFGNLTSRRLKNRKQTWPPPKH